LKYGLDFQRQLDDLAGRITKKMRS